MVHTFVSNAAKRAEQVMLNKWAGRPESNYMDDAQAEALKVRLREAFTAGVPSSRRKMIRSLFPMLGRISGTQEDAERRPM